MKRFLLSFLLTLGFTQNSFANVLTDVQAGARHIIPSSKGLNKAVASMAGTAEVKVQDLVNTYTLPVSMWLLSKLLVHSTNLHPTYKEHLRAFLMGTDVIYLGGTSYAYLEEAYRTSNSAQFTVFAINFVTGLVFIKWWWHGH